MPRIIAIVIAALLSGAAMAQTHVDGHYRRDGTYVPPHHRTNPNGSLSDNWSTRGNSNPYTGEKGTIDPYRQRTPSYGSGLSDYGGSIYQPKRRGY
jgi:hypothetical protein